MDMHVLLEKHSIKEELEAELNQQDLEFFMLLETFWLIENLWKLKD